MFGRGSAIHSLAQIGGEEQVVAVRPMKLFTPLTIPEEEKLRTRQEQITSTIE